MFASELLFRYKYADDRTPSFRWRQYDKEKNKEYIYTK